MLRLVGKSIAWVATGILLVAPSPARSADEGGPDIPITDPMLLERLGFAPDATNVYATPQAYEELLMDPVERTALQETRREARLISPDDPALGGPYGTFSIGYTPVSASGILPEDSSTEHRVSAPEGRFCLSGVPYFRAPFDALPHGARFRDVELWFNDTSPDHLFALAIRECQPDFDAGVPVTTVLGSFQSPGDGGLGWGGINLVGDDIDIDMQSCVYYAEIRLGGVDSNANCTEGSDVAIFKVRAGWRRQISPAPDEATFDDVPANHLFFQHIEALSASGITEGCDDDNFCPNAPLTRGAMAVFLAKALGLHWASF